MFTASSAVNPGRSRWNALFMRLDLDVLDEMTVFSADSLRGWGPMLSRDGRFLVYLQRGQVRSVPVEGGDGPQVLVADQGRVVQAALSAGQPIPGLRIEPGDRLAGFRDPVSLRNGTMAGLVEQRFGRPAGVRRAISCITLRATG